jgi:hypothetical protein
MEEVNVLILLDLLDEEFMDQYRYPMLFGLLIFIL